LLIFEIFKLCSPALKGEVFGYKQVKFKKTHNILKLLDLCINEDKEFEKLKELDLEGFS